MNSQTCKPLTAFFAGGASEQTYPDHRFAQCTRYHRDMGSLAARRGHRRTRALDFARLQARKPYSAVNRRIRAYADNH
jgi:hypothetical protein